MDAKEKNNIKDAVAAGASPSNPKPAPGPAAPAAIPAPLLSAAQMISNDRKTLPEQARQYLGAHLLANPSHALNEQLFRSCHSFKPITLTFTNLRANSKAFLSLQPGQDAIWSDGGESERLVGLSFSSRVDPVIYVRNFLINAREMYLQTYKDCNEIQVNLYLRTDQHGVKGKVDLPPGASVTLQSSNDRSTVIGLSSFAIDLE